MLLFTCACASTTQSNNKVQYPDWFYTPSGSGYIGGVGISGTHFNGKTAQRELAISRALDDIARQLGVSVATTSIITTSGSELGVSSNISLYSVQSVDGKNFQATIKEVWEHPTTKELYIYMTTKN